MEAEIAQNEQNIAEMEARLAKLKQAQEPDTPERQADLARLQNLKTELASLESEIARSGKCDPQMWEEAKAKLQDSISKRRLILENIDLLEGWVREKFNVCREDFLRMLGISNREGMNGGGNGEDGEVETAGDFLDSAILEEDLDEASILGQIEASAAASKKTDNKKRTR